MRRILAATLLGLAAWSCANAPVPNRGGDFTLINQDGQRTSLHDLKGKSVLLFFGYTHCPDACPTMLSKLSRVYRLLGDQKTLVQTVFVSVDPERDSPAALKEYLSNFSIPVIGLTGPKARIDQTISAYGGSYEITPSKSAAGPAVAHTTWLYLIDKDGQPRAQFEPGEDAEKIAGFVRQVTD